MYKETLKKTTAILMTVCLILSMFASTAFAAAPSDFSDINSSPAKEVLIKAVNNGLLNGNKGKIFPNDPLLRAQMAAIINRAFGAKEKSDISKFKDVSAKKWYAVDMAKAVRMGTFEGSGTNLAPEKTISRQDAFTVLARAFKLSTTDLTSLDKFSDKGQISSYAQQAIAALAAGDYLTDVSGKLNPKVNITRAEFAAVMDKLVSVYIKAEGTYTTVAEGNVLINKANVILKNVTITGDLIIGDGVGKGDVTLDNIKVLGRTIVRGGGSNSIHVINGSSITGTVNANNQVRIVTDKNTTIQNIKAGSQVILEGSFGEVSVTGNNNGVEVRGDIKTLTVETKAEIQVTKGTITDVDIKADAANTTVTVDKEAKIDNITAEAKTDVKGEGTVVKVEAKANDIKVETIGTEVNAAEGVTGVTAGGEPVEAGKSVITGEEVPLPVMMPIMPATPTIQATGVGAVVNGQTIPGTVSGSTASISLTGPDTDILTYVSIEVPEGSSMTTLRIKSDFTTETVNLTNLTSIPISALLPVRDNDVRLGTLRSYFGSSVTVTGTLSCPGYSSSSVSIQINLK